MEATAEKLTVPKPGRTARRFNLNMSAEAYADMEYLADLGGGRTLSEVFRLALSVLKAIYPAILRGDELFLFDPATNSERQIIVPK